MKKYLDDFLRWLFVISLITISVNVNGQACDNWITGPTQISCAELNQDIVYNAGNFTCRRGDYYDWSIEGGVIVSQNGQNTVTVQWTSPGTQRLSVVATCALSLAQPHCLEVNISSTIAPVMIDGEGTCDLLNPITLAVANANPNLIYYWYTDLTTNSSFTQGASYTQTFDQTTTYYVSSSDGVCESDRVPVTATVKTQPDAPTSAGSLSAICEGAKNASLVTAASADQNNITRWYDVTGNFLQEGEYLFISNPVPSTYYVAYANPNTGCESERLEVPLDMLNPIVSLTPKLAEGNLIIDETRDKVIAVTNQPNNNIPNHYWVWPNELPSTDPDKLSTVPQELSDNQSIMLYAYENGCWSTTPTTYTAVAASNIDMNWTLNRVYDEYGQVISSSKSYYDEYGNILQDQTKVYINDQKEVFASQPVYDEYQRPVISTLAAPIESTKFNYKSNFITKNGTAYTNEDFNTKVDNTITGSLGKYYSVNNSREPLTATTGFPYTRVEYYDDGTGELRRTAIEGDHFAIGNQSELPSNGNHQIFVKTFPLSEELNHYLTIRNRDVFPEATNKPLTLEGKGIKRVSRDVNGKETVTFIGKDGETLASAYVGEEYNQISAPISLELNSSIYWNNFQYDAEDEYLRFRLEGTDFIQIYKSFDDINYEILFEGDPTSLHTTNGISEILARQVTQSNTMYFQIRSFKEFELDILERDYYACETVCYTPVWKYHLPLSKTVNENNSFDFHISVNTTLVNLNGEIGANAKIIQLDDIDKKEKVIYTANFISNNLSYTLNKGFYRVELNTEYKSLPFSQVYSGNPMQLTYNYSMGRMVYHFYNDVGQLTTKISPEGVQQLLSNVPYHQIDKRTIEHGNLNILARTQQDEGRTEMVYSKDGVVRFYQNAYQKTLGYFSYTAFDKHGRIIETGEYRPSSSDDIFFELKNSLAPNSVYTILENFEVTVDYIGGLKRENCYDVERTFYDWPTTLPSAIQSRIQEFTFNGVSYTESQANPEPNMEVDSRTYYSYDENGRLMWMAQEFSGLVKTIDYEYDYFGNVISSIFQKDNIQEQFYHHYIYDKQHRLLRLETSNDGLNKVLQAKYYYYIHGPLKRIELGDDLQGVDYVYTINGWLKSINNVNTTNDPGKDGILNNLAKDIFQMQLTYFDDDYQSATNPITQVDISNNTSSSYYNGTIRAMSWNTIKPGQKSVQGDVSSFTYNYDQRYQIKNAIFGWLDGGNTFDAYLDKRYHVENISYDLNKNIKSLRRYDGSGNILHDFNYEYIQYSNKLANISSYASYRYDAIGRMIEQTNVSSSNNIRTVSYNSSSKVTKVVEGGLEAIYAYDDRGFRNKKIVNGVETVYVRDLSGNIIAIYESDSVGHLQLTEIPIYGIDRIGVQTKNINNKWESRYELKDHLGNVRAVFRRGVNKTTSYFTNIEDGNQQFEYWTDTNGHDNYNDIIRMDNTHLNSPLSIALDGDFQNKQFGPHVWIPVENGDKILSTVFFYAEELPRDGGTIIPGRVLGKALLNTTSLLSINAPINNGEGSQTVKPSINLNLLGIPNLIQKKRTTPVTEAVTPNYYKAWIRMELYESKDATDPKDSRASQIVLMSDQVGQWVATSLQWDNVDVPEDWCDGFIKVYIENQDNITLWFDDISVEHHEEPAKAEVISYTDYYPYGLKMRGSCLEGVRFGYQGDYAERDNETGWNAFELRMYDPIIGRWISPDPYSQYWSPYVGMSNNPTNTVDPDGGIGHIVVGVIVGSVVNVGAEWYKHYKNGTSASWRDYVGAAASGAIVGGTIAAVGPFAAGTATLGTITSIGVGGGVAGTAVIAATSGVANVVGNIVEQHIKYGEVKSKSEVIISGLLGTVTGAAGAYLNSAINKPMKNFINRAINTAANRTGNFVSRQVAAGIVSQKISQAEAKAMADAALAPSKSVVNMLVVPNEKVVEYFGASLVASTKKIIVQTEPVAALKTGIRTAYGENKVASKPDAPQNTPIAHNTNIKVKSGKAPKISPNLIKVHPYGGVPSVVDVTPVTPQKTP